MKTILEIVAPYASQYEAIAEGILVEALQNSAMRERFQSLARIDKRLRLVSALPQVRSDGGEARHDIILHTASKDMVRVELKGSAPFTGRQQTALIQGKHAKPTIRMDVLIIPAWRKAEIAQTAHPSIKIVTWEDIDRSNLFNPCVGRLADLWLGQSIIPWKQLCTDGKSYIAYRRGERTTATWRYFWKTLSYCRDQLSDLFDFNKIGGMRKSEANNYSYGMHTIIKKTKTSMWIGWILARGRGKSAEITIVAVDHEDVWPVSHRQDDPDNHFRGDTVPIAFEHCDDGTNELNLDSFCKKLRTGIARIRSN